jgi:hypothetical protein
MFIITFVHPFHGCLWNSLSSATLAPPIALVMALSGGLSPLDQHFYACSVEIHKPWDFQSARARAPKVTKLFLVS